MSRVFLAVHYSGDVLVGPLTLCTAGSPHCTADFTASHIRAASAPPDALIGLSSYGHMRPNASVSVLSDEEESRWETREQINLAIRTP
jgi:hypothetical protein